jgi:uncharacterized protein YgiM (DUF1202 family)
LRVLSALLFALVSIYPLAAEGFPYIGRIQVGNSLNVRSAPKLDAQVLGRLKNEDRVVVIAEEGKFVQLQYPKQLQTWVAGWLLLGKGQGKSDVVARNSVNVRSGAGMQHPQVARLEQGSKITILELNKDNWVRIGPPSQATAWVSSKYVKPEGTVAAHQAKQQEKNQGLTLYKQGVATFKRLLESKTMTEQQYQQLKVIFQKVVNVMPGTPEAKMANEHQVRLAEFRGMVRLDELKRQEEVKLKVREDVLAKEHEARMAALQEKAEEKKVRDYAYEGWLDDVGGILFRPASHRLKKGDDVLFYLKSDKVDLDLYSGKHVGINGKVSRFRGWGRIVEVEEIEILHDNPSSFWSAE